MKLLPIVSLGVFAVGAWAQDSVEDEVREVLRRAERYREPEARVHYLLSRGQDSDVRQGAVEVILAREDGLEEALLKAASGEKRGANRRLAMVALLGLEVELHVILELAVADRDKTVLPVVADRIAKGGRGVEAVKILAPGLRAKKSVERLRTARALGEIGDASAVAPLRAALKTRGCACSKKRDARANAAFLKQTAYVRGYSVEIA